MHMQHVNPLAVDEQCRKMGAVHIWSKQCNIISKRWQMLGYHVHSSSYKWNAHMYYSSMLKLKWKTVHWYSSVEHASVP